MCNRSLGLFLAIGTALYTTTAAHAAGFVISDKSVSSLGLGFAGQAALAEDASTIYNNPAGMVQLDGRQVTLGLNGIEADVRFHDSGSDTTGSAGRATTGALVPHFYFVEELTPDLRAGFGVYSPFGLGLKYESDWIGRYHTLSSEAHTVNAVPALAWRPTPAVSVGASIDIQYLDATMSRAIDFSRICFVYGAPCGGDGTAQLKGDSWSAGYSLGAQYAVSQTTRLGAVFHSGVQHHVSGRSTFDHVPALLATTFTDSGGKVTMSFPAIASLSGSWDATDRLTLLADYTWTGWSSYKGLTIQFDNNLPDSAGTERWRDVARYGIGARYRVSPAWLLRAGFSYDETPIPNARQRTPKLPDVDRRWYSLGARWSSSPDFSLDVAWTFMNANDVPIDNTEGTTRHLLKGSYGIASSTVSVQGNWRF